MGKQVFIGLILALSVLFQAHNANAGTTDQSTDVILTPDQNSFDTTDSSDPGASLTQKLLTIDNDSGSDVWSLNLLLNSDGTVQGLMTSTVDPSGQISPAVETFPVASIESQQGIVLVTRQGLSVITLQGHLDTPTGEGTYQIRYLTNGLFGSYKICPVLVRRDDANEWQVISTSTNQVISNVHVLTSSIGIRALQGACP